MLTQWKSHITERLRVYSMLLLYMLRSMTKGITVQKQEIMNIHESKNKFSNELVMVSHVGNVIYLSNTI